jgi:Tfp pilus assembly protein PilN
MIRINLIAERKPEKSRKPLITLESGNEALGNVVMAAVIALAVLFCGYKYVSMRSTISDLGVKIADANKERERLKEILKKGEEFKAQRELLQRKVELITQLKKNQAVPVHLLDQISRNMPEFLWLEKISERGNSISLVGKATTYNAVSNFYNNLNQSSFFNNVTLGTTQQEAQGVSFSVSCQFLPARDQQAADTATDEATAATPAQGA